MLSLLAMGTPPFIFNKSFGNKPATPLMNEGRPVECSVSMTAGDYLEQKKYLQFKNLPVETFYDKTMVVKLEFDGTLNN